MKAEKLLEKVTKEYCNLNIKSGRWAKENLPYMAPEQFAPPSNQIKALINVIAPLLKDK